MSEPNIRDAFGKPRDGAGLNIISISQDESKTVRIIPPMKSLKEKGAYGVYHKQHYGYSVRDPRDATKTRMRPFLCVEETDENGLTKVSCPECRKIEGVKQKQKDDISLEVERLRTQGIVGAEAEAQAMKATEKATEWLKSHNLDKKWFIPVMCEDFTFGLLKVPHAAKKAIDKARKQLAEDEKADIFDIDTGAWVKITRTGTGRTTDYTATVVKEAGVYEGRRVTSTKLAPLSDDQLTKALELPDPNGPSIVRHLTIEQVRMLATGGGSPFEVETVLNLGQRSEEPKEREEAPAPRLAPVPAAKPILSPQVAATASVSTQAAPKAAPAPAIAPAAAAAAEDDEEARLEAQLAAARAKKAAAKMAAEAKPVQLLSPEALDDISDDDFVARFPPPVR